MSYVQPRVLLNVMRTYNVGAMEAYNFLNHVGDTYVFSNGRKYQRSKSNPLKTSAR